MGAFISKLAGIAIGILMMFVEKYVWNIPWLPSRDNQVPLPEFPWKPVYQPFKFCMCLFFYNCSIMLLDQDTSTDELEKCKEEIEDTIEQIKTNQKYC